jgi:hypothetical protein
MDEFISFDEDITVEDLVAMLKSPDDVGDILKDLDGRRADLMSKYFDFYGDQHKTERDTIEHLENRELYEERIKGNMELLAKTTNPAYKEQLEYAISQDKVQLTKVLNRLKKRDFTNVIVGRTQFRTNRMYANGLDKLADFIGKWFETGAVGPGTVKYGDKTYTAQ